MASVERVTLFTISGELKLRKGKRMNAILSKLADVCANHKTKEKLLVVPNLQAGYQLLEVLAREGTPWLNLRPVTPFELALETTAPELVARDLHLLSAGEALYIMETILAGMADRNELSYFAPLQQTGGLARIILNTVDEIRLAGLTSLGFDPTRLVSMQKGIELKNILCRYESALRTNCLADTTEVYRLAISRLCRGKQSYDDVLFLIPVQLETQPLSNKFLALLTRNRVTVLPQEPVLHLENPAASLFIAEEEPVPESPFTWLHRPEDAPEAKGIDIFHAYGSANEIREIFRRLKSSAVPLDQAMICYTSSRYIPLLFSLAVRHSVPVTFGEGIPLSFTRPGRFIEHLLSWLENKYSASLFHQILTGGDLDIFAKNALARVLRRVRIGWGRERYLPCLEVALQGLKESLHNCTDEDEGLASSLEAQIEHTANLLTFVAEIFAKIPATDADDTIDFTAFTAGLADVLCHARICNEKDALALEAIRTQLSEAAKACPGRAVEKEAVERVRLRLMAIHVGASPPRPGHIHAAGLSQGEWSQRPNTFVVGLDASFPGAGLQDPVLLDPERKNLCKALAVYADIPARCLFTFTRFLASRRGKVTLSYSSFDTAEGRPVAPASVLLQAFRLTERNQDADYSALLQFLIFPAGFIPDSLPESLAEEEWWLVAAQSSALDVESVTACYPGLAAGLQAEVYRDSAEFTTFDGVVTACCSSHDPRQNADRILSATQFEKLANCPFAYFIRYILRIEAPDEVDYDPGVWLDPMIRGSLLHDIYCQYLREINGSHDKARLVAIADRLITEMKEQLPPPSELVFEYEREELLRGLDVFWRVEQQSDSVPAFFEVPFGFGDTEISDAGIGLAEPVIMTLPGGGQIKLRGRIDRIDRSSSQNHYNVWDFKTGSMYGYSEQDYFKKGTQIQHALYAYAAEQILISSGYDKNAKIESAGYLFPTEKGEGERVVRLQTGREEVLAILEKGLEIIAGGVFCVTDNEGRCGFCDFTVICRNVIAIVRANLKRSNVDVTAWKELQEYE